MGPVDAWVLTEFESFRETLAVHIVSDWVFLIFRKLPPDGPCRCSRRGTRQCSAGNLGENVVLVHPCHFSLGAWKAWKGFAAATPNTTCVTTGTGAV